MRALIRLSILLGTPLHDVLAWPQWVIEAYFTFLSKEPSAADRTEIVIARLATFYMQGHVAKGTKIKLEDLLPHMEAWKKPAESSDGTLSENERAYLARRRAAE